MRLLICDMAGTVINERGLVYKTLLKTLNKVGVTKMEKEWYGLEKKEVINRAVNRFAPEKESLKRQLYLDFRKSLDESYFGDNSTISLIDDRIPEYFDRLRDDGILVTLNTGYDISFQDKIIEKFGMNAYIDGFISSQEVEMGRPAPFMIYELMRRNNIYYSNEVVKVGDTKNDIFEGINAKCGTTVGVLSGAGSRKDLEKADIISDNIISYLDEYYL